MPFGEAAAGRERPGAAAAGADVPDLSPLGACPPGYVTGAGGPLRSQAANIVSRMIAASGPTRIMT